MGFGIKELLVILVIVLLLFGTKKLKTIGSDLGSAIKGFRKSVGDEDDPQALEKPADSATGKPDAGQPQADKTTADKSQP